MFADCRDEVRTITMLLFLCRILATGTVSYSLTVTLTMDGQDNNTCTINNSYVTHVGLHNYNYIYSPIALQNVTHFEGHTRAMYQYQNFLDGVPNLVFYFKCYNLPFFGWRYGNVDNYSPF